MDNLSVWQMSFNEIEQSNITTNFADLIQNTEYFRTSRRSPSRSRSFPGSCLGTQCLGGTAWAVRQIAVSQFCFDGIFVPFVRLLSPRTRWARWAGLGKLLGLWPLKTKIAQLQKALAAGLEVVVVHGQWFIQGQSLHPTSACSASGSNRCIQCHPWLN